ncbi:MAG TPA: glycosyltransferase N-terminal domain-containing protein [Candidatus Eisenbacteria bacterium]
MALGLSIYRGLTAALAPVAALGALAPAGSAWRAALAGASDETARSAGAVWIHAASMGEVGAAGIWARALAASGARPPFLLTTRTRAGLARAERELGGLVAARIAPLDLPRILRGLLDAARPSRLDIVETEIWPNLILEARRSGVAVVFVSASVSARTAGRLRALGAAGPRLFGDGVFVLAQTEGDASRFRSLGVPAERTRLAGDLKSDEAAAPSAAAAGPAGRPLVVFGSLRPGEEETARRVAEALDEVAGRPLLLVAPRHEEGVKRALAAFSAAGIEVLARDEPSRAAETLDRWIDRSVARRGRRVALLATHGELAEAYGRARAALVGGTFAPFGGHNPLEAASRGCPVVVGPHHQAIASAVARIVAEGGAIVAPDGAAAAAAAIRFWDEAAFAEAGAAARRAARAGAGAAERALAALDEWGIAP